jgi:Excreted virulence factor EspC, type VII ESX diderm
VSPPPPKYQANLASINGNANILVELAGALGAGRPDFDLSRKGCMEALPDDVTNEIRKFADFATDQYQDVVALLSALSTKLRSAGAAYGQVDQANAARIDRYLEGSRYVAPEQR